MLKTFEVTESVLSLKKHLDEDSDPHLEFVKHLKSCSVCKDYLTEDLCPIGHRLLQLCVDSKPV